MKKLYKIIFFLLIICLNTYSQTQEAIIYFKDGDSIEGFASLKFNKIKFKVAQEDKPDIWDDEFVKKIAFLDFGAARTFEYVKLNSLDKPKLIEIITKGEATLYKKLGSDYNLLDQIYNPHDGYPKITGTNLNPAGINSAPQQVAEYYYLKKPRDKYPTCLNCGVINAWRKNTSKFFADCDFIVKKLKGDKWVFEDIEEIVEFYNDICLGE